MALAANSGFLSACVVNKLPDQIKFSYNRATNEKPINFVHLVEGACLGRRRQSPTRQLCVPVVWWLTASSSSSVCFAVRKLQHQPSQGSSRAKLHLSIIVSSSQVATWQATGLSRFFGGQGRLMLQEIFRTATATAEVVHARTNQPNLIPTVDFSFGRRRNGGARREAVGV